MFYQNKPIFDNLLIKMSKLGWLKSIKDQKGLIQKWRKLIKKFKNIEKDRKYFYLNQKGWEIDQFRWRIWVEKLI